MTINQQVRRFATQHFGRRVGGGECFDLADQALRHAGAKSAADYGSVTPSANYVWGRATTVAHARAGDIIQFRNFRCTVTTVTTTHTDQPNGGHQEETETQTETKSRPHHTAIVDSVGSHGEMTVLEQNVGGVRSVVRNNLFFTSRTVPPRTTRNGNQTITVRRTISVTGQVWFYRPQARP